MSTRPKYVKVFAVIRIDLQNFNLAAPGLSLRAVEVLPTLEEAERERDRLNNRDGAVGAEYVVSASHWYPSGRELATAPAPHLIKDSDDPES